MALFGSRAKARLTLGLTALILGMALIAPAPARAADFGFDGESEFRPPVQRYIVLEERRIAERPVIGPVCGYGYGYPAYYGYPGGTVVIRRTYYGY